MASLEPDGPTSCDWSAATGPHDVWPQVTDVVGARRLAAEAVEAADLALGVEDPLAAAEALRRAGKALARAGAALEDAALYEVALGPVNLPAGEPGQSAGQRVRELREALGLLPAELAVASGLGAGAVRGLEKRQPFRPRVAVCVAHGLAAVAYPGQIDPDALAADLTARMDRDGLLLAAGNFDGEWITRRLRHQRRLDVEQLRRKVARRRMAAST